MKITIGTISFEGTLDEYEAVGKTLIESHIKTDITNNISNDVCNSFAQASADLVSEYKETVISSACSTKEQREYWKARLQKIGLTSTDFARHCNKFSSYVSLCFNSARLPDSMMSKLVELENAEIQVVA